MPKLTFPAPDTSIARYPDEDLSPRYGKYYLPWSGLPQNTRVKRCYWQFDTRTPGGAYALWYEPSNTANSGQISQNMVITFPVANVSGASGSAVIALGARADAGPVRFIDLTFVIEFEYLTSPFSLDKSSVEAGSSLTVTLQPRDAAYSHRITLEAGDYRAWGELAPGEKTFTHTLPPDWLNAFPDTVQGACTCRVETFRGTEKLGEETQPFTLLCPEAVLPSCQMTLEGVNGFEGLYLAGRTGILCRIGEESAPYGARITGWGVGAHTGREVLLQPMAPGEYTLVGWVRDSRGRRGESRVSLTVWPYSPPALKAPQIIRSDAQGLPAAEGSYIGLKAQGVFSPLDGHNGVTLQGSWRPVNGTWSPWQDFEQEQLLLGGEMAAHQSYEARIRALDRVGQETLYQRLIPTARAAMHLRPGGRGAAFGMYQEHDGRLSIPGDWDFYKGDTPLVIPPEKLCRQNLLDNSSFADPIAQAGLNGKHGNDAYAFDRWKATSVTASKQPECMRLTASVTSARIGQKLEAEGLAGKTVTVAVKANAPGRLYAGLYYSQAGASKYINASWDALNGIACVSGAVPEDATGIEFRIYPAYTADCNYADVYWAALYEGSYTKETLPPYIPKGYGHELVECMRYFQRVNAQVCASGMTTESRYYAYNLPIPMRVAPSMTNLNIAEYQTMTATGGSGAANNLYSTLVRAKVDKSLTNVNNGLWVMFRCDLNADL